MKLALILLLAAAEFALADAMLRVRPHITAKPNSEVKLSQLVDGQGLSAQLSEKLSSISLSMAPAYGEKQEIANANLTAILRPLIQAEREMRGGERLHVVIPKSVVIDTAKRELSEELVKTELLQAWQPLCPDCRLEVENLSLPKMGEVRDWTLRVKPELPRGSFSVAVDIVRENGAPTMAWISGRIAQKRRVPVAKRALNQGERVLAQDFGFEYRYTSFAIDGVPLTEDFNGRRMKQGLRAGDVLWKGMIEKEKAIRAGDLVQLKSAEGMWEVSMRVIAQQDAFIGDVINLKNPKTNNTLVGQVTGQGEVELR